jgi:hypothetical protein
VPAVSIPQKGGLSAVDDISDAGRIAIFRRLLLITH